MPTPGDEGLTSAARRVAEHGRTLVALELRLAQLELSRKARALGVGIGLAAAAGLLALLAVPFFFAALAAALSEVMPVWAGILIAGGVLLLLAAVLGLAGLRLLRRGAPPVPEQAIDEARRTTAVLRSDGRN